MVLKTPIKITMLGTGKAGKTCFMLGMYSIMREGVHGFTLSTPDTDVDLELDDRYQKIVQGEGESRWPEGSDQSIGYSFHYNYCLRGIVAFDWLDYRGGALDEARATPEVQVLKDALRESSTVFLCVSAQHFQKPLDGTINQVRHAVRTARMTQLFTESMAADSASAPSIAIVLTKYDYVRLAGREQGDVVNDVKRLFSTFFHKGGGFRVAICPVTLGDALAKDSANGIIEPVGLHQPVSYATCMAVKALKDRLLGQQTTRRNVLSELEGGFFSSIFKKETIANVQREIQASASELDKIDKVLPLLYRDLLDHCILFEDGDEVKA